jgi:Tripartite tricarboxylate transporter family receptor
MAISRIRSLPNAAASLAIGRQIELRERTLAESALAWLLGDTNDKSNISCTFIRKEPISSAGTMPIIPFIAALAALVVATAPAFAQSWPNRPITMVVPFAAGGASDVIARIVAEALRAELGQTMVVENVGGAGGMVGANRVAKASPDGYQMVLGNVGTHAQTRLSTRSRSTTRQAISPRFR